MKKRILFHMLIVIFMLIFLIFAFPALGHAAQAVETAADTTLSPYFFVESEDVQLDSFPLKETNVTANITGLIADVYVSQSYANEGGKPINVSYVFPTSTRVAVHGMKIAIGDNMVIAQIKEREEARQEYEQAKGQGKNAALLEQERPNVFTMSVANIMPGDVVCVELHYTELILAIGGAYEFVFPTVVAPRYSNQPADTAPQTDQWVANPYLEEGSTTPSKYGITVNLSTGIPISSLNCKSHDVEVNWDGESAAQITLSTPEKYAGDRDYVLEYTLIGQDVQCGLMLQAGDTENYFMLMLQPPQRVQVDDKPPREYVFVLDVSGSMSGFPLDTAKELLTDFLDHLKETDRFNLVLFDNTSRQMSPNSLPATAENIKTAFDMIEREFGGGGTELLSAIELAVAIPMDKNVSRSVIVITDGEISAEQAVFDFIGNNLENTNYFAFGIGSAVNRYLVEGIAKTGLGESFVATKPSEVPDIADNFRTYIESPVLADIAVTYAGFDAYDVEPPNLPILFTQKPIALFGKYRGELTGIIRVTGKTGNSEYVQEIQLSETEPLETNTAIGLLWARKTVERLLDYKGSSVSADVKQKAIEIGLKYSIMTPYTSFVAVLETIRNHDGDSIDVDQPLPLPLGVSNLAVGGGYATLLDLPAPLVTMQMADGGILPYLPQTGDNKLVTYCILALLSLACMGVGLRLRTSKPKGKH
jgi:Ca-activated chloride channel family protein